MLRPPILVLTIGFGIGLLLAERGSGSDASGVALSLLLALPPVGRRLPLGAAIAIMAGAGFLWGGAAVRERAATCAGRWSREAGAGRGRGESARSATVRLVDPVSEQGGVSDAEVAAGGLCGGGLRLRWPEGHRARGGTTWVVAGRWVGDAERGLLVVRHVRPLDLVPRGRGALRDAVAARAATLFGTRAPVVEALVIARRTEVEPAIRDRYAQAGLAHLLVIAGLHVGFLAGWLSAGLAMVGVLPRRRVWITGSAVLAYVWLLGFPAPATRAAVMFLLHAFARWRERVVAPRGLVSLTALVLLVGDPWAMRSAGAWLSVSAVGAVVWAARAAAHLPRAARAVAPALAATLVTAPISAFAFGTVAPIGVVANLVAIPIASIAVPGLVLAVVASWIVPAAGTLLAAGSGFGLALLDAVARTAAAVPGGHMIMEAGWRAALLWLGVSAAAWWLWRSPRRAGLIAARLALIAALLAWGSLAGTFHLDECRCLTVFFLDVGQGDAALLRTPGAHWIVIDGGPRTPQGDAGRRVVVPFLRRAGAGGVAVVVATHGDADHLGGLPAVIAAFAPRLVLEPGEPLGRPLYLEFLAGVEESGARYRTARAGDRVDVDGVRLDVLSPDSAWLALPMDVNDHGVVLRVTYGATRILFQADAGLPMEAHLAGRVGPVKLLKVGHHGSRTATSDAWLNELTPEIAVISVGGHNRYGHPAPEVVARLEHHGIRILRTDHNGTITFATDGDHAHSDVSHPQ